MMKRIGAVFLMGCLAMASGLGLAVQSDMGATLASLKQDVAVAVFLEDYPKTGVKHIVGWGDTLSWLAHARPRFDGSKHSKRQYDRRSLVFVGRPDNFHPYCPVNL